MQIVRDRAGCQDSLLRRRSPSAHTWSLKPRPGYAFRSRAPAEGENPVPSSCPLLRSSHETASLFWVRIRRNTVPKNLNVLPNPALKPEVTDCPEGNLEEWIVCCPHRFFPLARRIAGEDALAEDVLQISRLKILQSIHHAYLMARRPVPG